MENNKIDLSRLFEGLQNQMKSRLNTNRDSITHPGSKGDALENVWIEWLDKYLPNRYCVNKAIVIDSTGHTSDQIDLVIYDQQYTPFVFRQNGIYYIPAEGVYAVFEVKPDLNGSAVVNGESVNNILYAGLKIESVRRLIRTSTNIIDRGITKNARPLTKILGGILTSVNTYSKVNTVEKHLCSTNGLKSLDMGCIIEGGSFYVDYNGVENESDSDFNDRINNYYKNRTFDKLVFSSAEKSLVTFFLQLLRYLQQSIGTVAAIDLKEYSANLDFDLDQKI